MIGAPVYAGRVPEPCLERLASFRAGGAPAAVVAVYGNRAYEDALVELRDAAVALGFRVVAAGAFLGEHSYATPGRPIAAGRPDAADLEAARGFGAAVARKLAEGRRSTPQIPGDVPYRERPAFPPIIPATDPERCTGCGTCIASCPAFAIGGESVPVTRAGRCLLCCACTRACPQGAREMVDPYIEQRRQALARNCGERREPEWFL